MATEPYKIPRHIRKARSLLNWIGQAHLLGIGGRVEYDKIMDKHLKPFPFMESPTPKGGNKNKWAGDATNPAIPARVIKAIASELIEKSNSQTGAAHLRAYEVAIPERKKK